MRNILLVSILVFAFTLSPVQQGHELTGLDIFNSGPFKCDPTAEVRHEAEWVNDIRNIRIYNANLWMGASVDAVADVGMIAYLDNRSILFHENWDRYANPTGFSVDALNLSPNYMSVRKGESVNFVYWCHNFDQLPSRGHVIVTVWFAED